MLSHTPTGHPHTSTDHPVCHPHRCNSHRHTAASSITTRFACLHAHHNHHGRGPRPACSSRCVNLLSECGSTITAHYPATHSDGSFNPTAGLPPKVVQRILDLEFVEVTVDAEPTQIPGRPPVPGRCPITNISQWVERYSLMAATLASRFPDKAPELFAYQATIVHAERNMRLEGGWLTTTNSGGRPWPAETLIGQ